MGLSPYRTNDHTFLPLYRPVFRDLVPIRRTSFTILGLGTIVEYSLDNDLSRRPQPSGVESGGNSGPLALWDDKLAVDRRCSRGVSVNIRSLCSNLAYAIC